MDTRLHGLVCRAGLAALLVALSGCGEDAPPGCEQNGTCEPPGPSPTPLTLGSRVEGTLAADELLAFTFEAPADGRYGFWYSGGELTVIDASGARTEGQSLYPVHGGSAAFVLLRQGEEASAELRGGSEPGSYFLYVETVVDDAGDTRATAKAALYCAPATCSPAGFHISGHMDYLGDVDSFAMQVRGGWAYRLQSFNGTRIHVRDSRVTFEDAAGQPVTFPVAHDQTVYARVTSSQYGYFDYVLLDP